MNEINLTLDLNSKKHFIKIFNLIENNLINSKNKEILKIILNLNLNEKKIELFEKLFSFNLDDIVKLNLNNIKEIDYIDDLIKINLKYQIYTLENNIEDYFFKKYKLNIIKISKYELEELLNSNENLEDVILITDEDLYIDLNIFNKEEFENILIGKYLYNNIEKIKNINKIISIIEEYNFEIFNLIKDIIFFFEGNKIENIDDILKKLLESKKYFNTDFNYDEIYNYISNLDEKIEILNKELEKIILEEKIELSGDDLLKLLKENSKEDFLKKRLENKTFEKINLFEKEIIKDLNSFKLKTNFVFENKSFPVKLDLEIKEDLFKQIDKLKDENEFKTYKNLSKLKIDEINIIVKFLKYFDSLIAIYKFHKEYNLNIIGNNNLNEIILIDAKNIQIKNAFPISYGICSNSIILNKKLNGENIAILTGANSGGKTTLLEMFIQNYILFYLGIGICASKNSTLKYIDKLIYLKKFSGSLGAGAFEQTIKKLIEILDDKSSKFILIDEFEAITEPGAAAKILINFLIEINKQKNSYVIVVSHLGEEINLFLKQNNITGIRIDGISAKGIDEKNGKIITNHQPEFYSLGKSTPELILKKILNEEKFWKDKNKETKLIFEKLINSKF
jgi:hypothetical protein